MTEATVSNWRNVSQRVPAWDIAYAEGYRNGRLDRKMRETPLQTSGTSHIPGYGEGYTDGWNGATPQVGGVT